MGVWMRGQGRLRVVPAPDEKLIQEYRLFSRYSIPDSYRPDEPFTNTWFFDKNNRLACLPGKFAEPSIWLDHLKKWFFEPRGYQLVGDPDIVGETECDFWNQKLLEELDNEYEEWRDRFKGVTVSLY